MTDYESPAKPSLIPQPFKPHPVLFAATLLIFAAWVGFMVWMYVKTVYPTRHGAPPSPTVVAPAK